MMLSAIGSLAKELASAQSCSVVKIDAASDRKLV